MYVKSIRLSSYLTIFIRVRLNALVKQVEVFKHIFNT